MSTKRVVIECEERLEGAMREGPEKAGVVICHPHPLYGGSMANNVVEALEDGFFRIGFTTLRFNFRGVGGSTGNYDEGKGEVQDVAAAYAFLKERLGGGVPVVVAGYSFGAWVCTKAAVQLAGPPDLCLVAYPFSVYPSDELLAFTGKICLIGGSSDDISPLDPLLSLYDRLKAEKYLKVLPSSHFFQGREEEIAAFVAETFGQKAG